MSAALCPLSGPRTASPEHPDLRLAADVEALSSRCEEALRAELRASEKLAPSRLDLARIENLSRALTERIVLKRELDHVKEKHAALAAEYRRKLDKIQQYMRHVKMHPALRARIRAYCAHHRRVPSIDRVSLHTAHGFSPS